MATKPTSTAEWALNEIIETIGPNNFVNRVEPPQGIKDDGVLAIEPWSRPFLNYQLYIASQWFQYLDEAFYPIGSTYQETLNVNPSSTLGLGTWITAGNVVTGVTTIYFWERTA